MSTKAIEQERMNRIRLSLWAYAYEFKNVSLVSDAEFDRVSYSINTKIKTGNPKLDKFFDEHFEPYTGYWIYRHPELDKLALKYENIISFNETEDKDE